MADATMKGLSIRQPWPFAILHLGKPVENRSWRPPQSMLGKRFLLHAAKGCTGREYDEAKEAIYTITGGCCVPCLCDLDRGGIVGSAILDRVILPGGWSTSRVYPSARAARHRDPLADSPWYTGEYGLVLSDVQELPFTPLRGALGFFNVPDEVVERLGVAA